MVYDGDSAVRGHTTVTAHYMARAAAAPLVEPALVSGPPAEQDQRICCSPQNMECGLGAELAIARIRANMTRDKKDSMLGVDSCFPEVPTDGIRLFMCAPVLLYTNTPELSAMMETIRP